LWTGGLEPALPTVPQPAAEEVVRSENWTLGQ
jgi:hypothetical protein